MGTISYNTTCKKCVSENAYEDSQYKTGEYFTICRDCGYVESVFILRKKGVKILKDNTKGINFENLIFVKREINNHYGVFFIKRNGNASFAPMSKRKMKSTKNNIKVDENLQYAFFRRWNGKKYIDKFFHGSEKDVELFFKI